MKRVQRIGRIICRQGLPLSVAWNPLVFQRCVSEIHKYSQLKATCLQVIIYLSVVFVGESRHSLQLNYYLVETDEIHPEVFFQFLTFIYNTKSLFAFIGDATQLEFRFEGFLIQRFSKATSKHVVDFHSSSNDIVRFLTKKNLIGRFLHISRTVFSENKANLTNPCQRRRMRSLMRGL